MYTWCAWCQEIHTEQRICEHSNNFIWTHGLNDQTGEYCRNKQLGQMRNFENNSLAMSYRCDEVAHISAMASAGREIILVAEHRISRSNTGKCGEQVSESLAQTRCFWCCLLFKSGLTQGMRQLKPMSCIRLCVVVEALTPAAIHSLWISPTFLKGVLFHNPLQCAVIPFACTLFFYHIFSFPSPLY